MSPISIALKQARQAKGLTQVQLAEKADVSQRAISEMEAGKTIRLNLEILDRLCRALDVEPGELLERDQKSRKRR